MAILMTLRRSWPAIDASQGNKDVTIPAGTHEMERIPHPRDLNCNWLVMQGTLIGGSEVSWRDWIGSEGDFEIVIEENGVLLTAPEEEDEDVDNSTNE